LHENIGHYRIIGKPGAGGMGVVCGACDDRLRPEVAIKLLPEGVASDDARKARVLAEARAAAALNHSGAAVFDVREEECGAFIVMEQAAGRTLRELMRDKEIDGRRLRRLGAQVADALEAARRRGIVHCDIKPENIIFQPGERVKLRDFGIASTNAATLAMVTVRTGEIAEPLPAEVSGTRITSGITPRRPTPCWASPRRPSSC
jgi:serine/threonine protein kinase